MTTISKEKLARIQELKKELLQARTYYSNKIYPLQQKETLLRSGLATVGIWSSKLAARREQNLQEIKDELNKLKQERDDKLKKLEKELASLKKDYRDNYEKYKEADKKAKENERSDKIKDIKIFLDQQKYALIFGGILVGITILIMTVGIIKMTIERSRDYYVYVDENYTYDCNARYDGGFSAYCEDRFISGSFSNYDTVSFSWANDIEVNGNNFTKKVYDYVDPSVYRKEDFDVESLREGMDATHDFGLWNNVLDREVVSKTVYIHYNFSDSDLSIINKLHEEWIKEETEKKKKEEQEAKAQAEKEEAERKAAEEQKAKEDAEKKAAEEKAAAQKATEEQKRAAQDNGEELPDDISPYDIKELCERGFESLGYSNASIKMSNQYAMGYPPYIYVIVGTLSMKSGLTSSRQQVGTIQCQANWQKWTIKSLYVGGKQVY